MIYFANPTKTSIPHMQAHTIGLIDTPDPKQKIRPANAIWCADNACFAQGFDPQRWWTWLNTHLADVDRCWFATAPDVVGDAAATLELSAPWLPRIRALGYPAAFVAQDGVLDTTVPWDDFDLLFLGGTNTFKLGDEGRAIAAQARAYGKKLHMGRVNSLKRWRYAEALGCQSCDGTFLVFAPNENLAYVLSWIDDLANRPALFTPEELLA